MVANFEESHVALSVIEIPLDGRGHGDGAGGLQDVGFFAERIREFRGNRFQRDGIVRYVPRKREEW